MKSIGKVMDSLSTKYKNLILISDFNATEFDTSVENLCDIYSFENLIKELTCFKNPHNPKCYDITQIKKFSEQKAFETGLSDIHKMSVTVLQSTP